VAKKESKKEEMYSFTGAASKGESSARRVCKSPAIVYYPRVEYIGGDDILKMLQKLNSSVAVLQFGDKN
jgi:hypothetical protein